MSFMVSLPPIRHLACTRHSRKSHSGSSSKRARKNRAADVGTRLLLSLILLGFGSAVLAQEATEREFDFDIPQQAVHTALTEFAEQADLTLVFPDDLVREKSANALIGRYTLQEGVDILLAGTGLTPTFSNHVVLSISADEQPTNEGNTMDMKKKVPLLKRLGTVIATAIFATSGAAAIAADEANEPVTRELEEVVVTAQKRAENMYDLPIAISAFSGEDLSRGGVTGIRDLKQMAPSLQYGTHSIGGAISIRGIGAELNNIGAEPGVVVSQDGVPIASQIMFDTDFFDVERVEVLRGPQGTINGRNATGGAVNIHSALPTDQFEAGLEVSLGNYNGFAAKGLVSGELSGSLFGRIAFSTDKRDGWLTNTLLGQDAGERDRRHVRGSLVAKPTDWAEVTLIVDLIDDDSNHGASFDNGRARPDVPSLPEIYSVAAPDKENLTLEADQANAKMVEQQNYILEAEFRLSDRASLTSTTAYLTHDGEIATDYDGTRLSASNQIFLGFDIDQFSQEITLAADLNESTDLILGGFYMNVDSAEPALFTGALFGTDLFTAVPSQELDTQAVYGQLRYSATDALRVSLGLRYTEDKKRNSDKATCCSIGSAPFFDGGAGNTWTAVTGKVAVDYAPGDRSTLFANAARGFKGGGFNSFSYPLDEYQPEFVWSYEIGAKTTSESGRLRFAATTFFMDYKGLQQVVYAAPEGSLSPIGIGVENAAAATIKGLEVEAEMLIGNNLDVNVAGSWINARFDEFVNFDRVFPELGNQDLSGNRLARSPDAQYVLGIKYSRSFSRGFSASLRVDYQWQDKVYFTFYNQELIAQSAYGLLNLRLELAHQDRWTVAVYANNVRDERYLSNAQSAFPGGNITQVARLGWPRMYGLTIGYEI